jgi:hypothetical protein
MKLNGYVINKFKKRGIFSDKYYIVVKFEKPYNRLKKDEAIFHVNKDSYDNYIKGAFIRGQFEQIPEGMKPLYLF